MTGLIGWRRFSIVVMALVLAFTLEYTGHEINSGARDVIIALFAVYFGGDAMVKRAQANGKKDT